MVVMVQLVMCYLFVGWLFGTAPVVVKAFTGAVVEPKKNFPLGTINCIVSYRIVSWYAVSAPLKSAE